MISYFLILIILVYSSITDITHRKIKNIACILIFLIGIARIIIGEIHIIESLFAFIIIALPVLILAKIRKGSIGGGDLKLIMSLCFSLGMITAFVMLISLSLGLIYAKVLKQKNIPLAPFVLIGFLIMGGAYV